MGDAEILSQKRSPGDKRRARTTPAIFAMTMRNVIRFAAYFVANSTAETPSLDRLLSHFADKLARPERSCNETGNGLALLLGSQVKSAAVEINDRSVQAEVFGPK